MKLQVICLLYVHCVSDELNFIFKTITKVSISFPMLVCSVVLATKRKGISNMRNYEIRAC